MNIESLGRKSTSCLVPGWHRTRNPQREYRAGTGLESKFGRLEIGSRYDSYAYINAYIGLRACRCT